MTERTNINLWSAMVTLESQTARGGHPHPKVTEENLRELSHTARWGGQELSVEASDEGWIINVFSCYSEDGVTGIKILIPKQWNEPVKVLQDRNGRLEFHHV